MNMSFRIGSVNKLGKNRMNCHSPGYWEEAASILDYKRYAPLSMKKKTATCME